MEVIDTMRKFAATVITAAGLMLAFSVTQGWNWPLLADARAGIIALGIVGFAACASSGWAEDRVSMKSPLLIIAILAGIVAFGAGVIGLFANTMPYLVVMMAATFVLWLTATIRYFAEGAGGPQPSPTVTA